MRLLKALIIDDDRATREALQFMFISRGWEVAMTETQTEGLALLADYDPEWVIVSWDQLRGSGRSFVDAVRADRPATRLAILTDTTRSSDLRMLRRLSPDYRASKPVNPEQVFRDCESECVARVAVG